MRRLAPIHSRPKLVRGYLAAALGCRRRRTWIHWPPNSCKIILFGQVKKWPDAPYETRAKSGASRLEDIE